MDKKGNLFSLIRSLTKPEKRHFKLTAATGDSNKNYLRLFDFLDKQEEFDEKAVKEHFRDKTFVKQLHVTKNYLNSLILKSLRNYHAKSSKSAELHDLLRDIEILFKKELFHQCHCVIEKALGVAEEYERQDHLLEIYAWKRKLILQKLGPAESAQPVNDLLQQEKDCLKKMSVLNEYRRLTNDLTEMFTGEPNDDVKNGKVEKIISHRLLRRPDSAATLQSKVLYHHILYAYFTIKNDLLQADKSLADLIALLEKQPHRIKDDPSSYITALTNRIGLCLFRKDRKSVSGLIAKTKAMPRKYGFKEQNPLTIRLLLRTYNVELELYRDTGQFEQGVALVEELKDFLKKYGKTIPADYKLLLCYQSAYLFFMNREYNKSLFWLNEIFRTNFGTMREDIQSYAQLLNLIIHFELGNTVVLKYAVDSCRRFLKKKRNLRQFERLLLRFFSKVSTAHPEKVAALLKQLQSELFTDMSEQDIASVLDYLNFNSWLESKLKSDLV